MTYVTSTIIMMLNYIMAYIADNIPTLGFWSWHGHGTSEWTSMNHRPLKLVSACVYADHWRSHDQ